MIFINFLIAYGFYTNSSSCAWEGCSFFFCLKGSKTDSFSWEMEMDKGRWSMEWVVRMSNQRMLVNCFIKYSIDLLHNNTIFYLFFRNLFHIDFMTYFGDPSKSFHAMLS